MRDTDSKAEKKELKTLTEAHFEFGNLYSFFSRIQSSPSRMIRQCFARAKNVLLLLFSSSTLIIIEFLGLAQGAVLFF